MFFEQLTENEERMIEEMRYMGVYDVDRVNSNNWVDTKTFLNFWEDAKSAYLGKIFSDKLILSKKIEVATDDDKLHSAMDDLFWSYDYSNLSDSIMTMLEDNQDIYSCKTSTLRRTIAKNLRNYMFSIDALISNRYEGETMELRLPDGSMFKLTNGAKVMKAMGRLAKAANKTEKFERIRLRQSQIMNQARINAELCLSIHPLDYMTASYNANDWRSCMCWEDGEYRRGVIEMMNSPYVVVAYTKSSHEELDIFWDRDTKSYVKWNSKKWREFFIVDPESGIFAIKGYPYWNRELEDTTLKWLAELYGWAFEGGLSPSITKWETDYNVELPGEDKKLNVSMHCGPAMYNDFYSGNFYHAIFANNVKRDRFDCLSINYSGASECICCGENHDYESFDSESELVCNECIPHQYCVRCGDRIYPQEGYCTPYNGFWYCDPCFENLPRCEICDKPYDDNNDAFSGIQFVVCDKDEKDSNLMCDEYDDAVCKCVCGDCANDVFVKGVGELKLTHKYAAIKWFTYYLQIPYERITPKGLELLYDEDIVADFVQQHIA